MVLEWDPYNFPKKNPWVYIARQVIIGTYNGLKQLTVTGVRIMHPRNGLGDEAHPLKTHYE